MSGIKYKIVKRVMRGITRYFPQVVYGQTLDTETFLKNVLNLGSTLTIGDLLAAVAMIDKGLRAELRRGNRVDLPWGSVGLGVKGDVGGADGIFRLGPNKFVPRLLPAEDLIKQVAKLQGKKVEHKTPHPRIDRIIDEDSGLQDQALTPGGIALLKGQDLRFDKHDVEQGIFLVAQTPENNSQSNKSDQEIRIRFYGEINPSQVSFVVPDLSTMAGDTSFRLRIKTRDRVTGEILQKGFKPAFLLRGLPGKRPH